MWAEPQVVTGRLLQPPAGPFAQSDNSRSLWALLRTAIQAFCLPSDRHPLNWQRPAPGKRGLGPLLPPTLLQGLGLQFRRYVRG